MKFVFRCSEEIDDLVDFEFASIFEVFEAPFGEKREREVVGWDEGEGFLARGSLIRA